MASRVTIFSADRLYRYTLWREWGVGTLPLLDHREHPDSICNFICLNPSSADETNDDPTIRRCIGYAKCWGYGAFVMTNLFAFRDTSPKNMMKHPSPIGLENDYWLLKIALESTRVVIAWGKDGEYGQRGTAIRQMLSRQGIRFYHLGRCMNGEPKHPPLLAKNLLPIPW